MVAKRPFAALRTGIDGSFNHNFRISWHQQFMTIAGGHRQALPSQVTTEVELINLLRQRRGRRPGKHRRTPQDDGYRH